MVSVIWSTATRKREESVTLQEPIHGNQYLTALPLERQIFIIPHTSSSCSFAVTSSKTCSYFSPYKRTSRGRPPLLTSSSTSMCNLLLTLCTEQPQVVSSGPSQLLVCFVLGSLPINPDTAQPHKTPDNAPHLWGSSEPRAGGAGGGWTGQAEPRDGGGCSTRTWAPTVAPAPSCRLQI